MRDKMIVRLPLLLALTIMLVSIGANLSGARSGLEQAPKIYLAFFGNPGCPPCDETWDTIIRLGREYPNLEARRFDFWARENIELAEALFELYGVLTEDRTAFKILFIGNDYLVGDGITENRLRNLINKYSQSGTEPPWEMVTPEEGAVKRFRRLDIFLVLAAGLADGVNPCAFAVAVFFVSYLAYLGKQREIMLVGVSFILAVFLTYFLVGAGILMFTRQLTVYPLASHLVKISVAGLALVLGSMSLYDYYLFKKGRAEEMKLQLPRAFKRKMHAIIRKMGKTAFIIPFAFATGVVISLFELGCTGQLYLPTIAYVVWEPSLAVQALTYLVLYNLMFILPLVAVFTLANLGVRSQRLAELARRHTGKVKILIAAVLFTLGVLLLASR